MISPDVSIIILSLNGGYKLRKCLEAIFKAGAIKDFEIIVIDSGSTDGTLDIIAGYPVKLVRIPPESFGHGRTRNLGASMAKGKILVFLSQDAVPADDNWLADLTAVFSDPNVAGAYGRQLPDGSSTPIERFFVNYFYGGDPVVKNSLDPDNCLLCDMFFSNVFSAIRRSEWEKTRFNEDLIMSEDQEWSKRVLSAGKKTVYVPEARVYHSHNYTLCELFKRNFDSGTSLRGLLKAPLLRSLSYKWAYMRAGFIFLFKNHHFRYMLIFPVYETVRILALLAGAYSNHLPCCIRKHLSLHEGLRA